MSKITDRYPHYDLVMQPFISALRTDGFKGSGKRFYRVANERIHLLIVQASVNSWSHGTFCVNLGAHYTFLPDSMELAVKPQTMVASSCAFDRRLAPYGQRDYWWKYGDTAKEATINGRHLVETYKAHANSFFAEFDALEGNLESINPEHLLSEHKDGLLRYGQTAVRNALNLARINLHYGNRQAGMQFAQFGLAQIGPATKLAPLFQCILEA